MPDLEPPVFVFSDDLASFATVSDALQYVEPIDVDEKMRVFDSQGQEVGLQVLGMKRTGILEGGGRIEITGVTSNEASTASFALLLREHAARLQQHLGHRWNSEADPATAPLPTLVNAVDEWTRTA